MNTIQKTEDFYKKLTIQLKETTTFPHIYLYKFIVPSKEENEKTVLEKFANTGAIIDTKKSKTGKYTSISIHVEMKNAEAIIQKYKDVSNVKGIISL